MTDSITPYDPANSLTSREAIAGFLQDALDSENPEYIAAAFKLVVKKHHVNNNEASVGSLEEDSLEAVINMLKDMELKLSVCRKHHCRSED